ncbi:MAG TPA: HNH endonuclease signature motif containing protein [bacterium]|nr:HNH endonuclease signature motif containing protein [bacterium]
MIDERDWKSVHDALTRHARLRCAQEFEEGQLLLAAQRTRAWVHDGCATFAQYVERHLGYDGRMTFEKLRVASALERLPLLASTLRDGAFCWSAIRELTRVATARTEEEWIAAARGRTVREIEELVAGHRTGDTPRDPRDPSLIRHVLRFELTAEEFALVRDALDRRRADSGLTHEASLVELVRAGEAAMRATADDATSSSAFQIAITRCPECERAEIETRAGPIEVTEAALEKAACDAEVVDVTRNEAHARVSRSIPPKTRRFVLRRARMRCEVPGCRARIDLNVHHIVLRSEGGTHDPDNLLCICRAHHTQLHEGYLTIDGRYSTGLTFTRADGSLLSEPMRPVEAENAALAFQALRQMGFGEGECRSALAAATAAGARPGTLEELIRTALRSLQPRARKDGFVVGEREAVYLRADCHTHVGIGNGQPARASRGLSTSSRPRSAASRAVTIS